MPKSALPEHLDEAHEWDGKDDDDHWYTSWRKHVKGWFAFGPRATEWWAKFREYPVTLLALRGNGTWRFETNETSFEFGMFTPFFHLLDWKLSKDSHYLSRVQYYNDWHIALAWPLFLHGHVGNWQFYIGFKRDADRVYWLALYLGKIWK